MLDCKTAETQKNPDCFVVYIVTVMSITLGDKGLLINVIVIKFVWKLQQAISCRTTTVTLGLPNGGEFQSKIGYCLAQLPKCETNFEMLSTWIYKLSKLLLWPIWKAGVLNKLLAKHSALNNIYPGA